MKNQNINLQSSITTSQYGCRKLYMIYTFLILLTLPYISNYYGDFIREYAIKVCN